MWTRRDFALLATAAIATFGITVAAFWPRLANAVDNQPPATTDVKVPTLNLEGASVSAALDSAHARTVILTVRNLTDSAATAQFAAEANVVQPVSIMSRGIPAGQAVWTNDYAVNLQPGETKAISVELPESAFVQQPPTPAPNSAQAQQTPMQMGMRPGRSYITLSTKGAPRAQSIQALSLPAKPEPTAVAKGHS